MTLSELAIYIMSDRTHGMPYSSMLLYLKLNFLASRREDLSHSFFPSVLKTDFCFYSLDHRLSPQESDLPEAFINSIRAHNATLCSYNMALIITNR